MVAADYLSNTRFIIPRAKRDRPYFPVAESIIDIRETGLSKNVDGPNVNVEFLIKDYETAEKIKSGELAGLSIDASVFADPVRRMVVGVKQYKRLTVCATPACRVCYFS